MIQGSRNNSLNSVSVELIQKPQIPENNGLKANIAEITRLIELLDSSPNEIISYLSDDGALPDDVRSPMKHNWLKKRSLSSSNSFTSNKSDAARVTQDLDHLLTSLSQYKLNQSSNSNLYDENGGSIGPDYVYSNNLQNQSNPAGIASRMADKYDVNLQKPFIEDKSASIPHCMLCNEPIFENSIAALDGHWHQHHFICYGCEMLLESAVYYVDNQQPYCEMCHINLFTDKCAYCGEPILDTSLSALDQHWHPEHFFCASCQAPFENDVGFHEHLRKPYCPECFFDLFGSRCAGCKNPITSTFLSAMGQKWHDNCFVCKECQSPFETYNFHEINGEPYCSQHYHLKMGMICGICKLPITTSLVNALGKKYHVQCFTCSYCLKSLAKCTFKESKSRPYCTECFAKLCS